MSSRVVIVDPHECVQLQELAELSGEKWLRLRAWPFAVGPEDRIVTTIPVPRGARAIALGVRTGKLRENDPDEVWPDITLDLAGSRAQILAYMSGAGQSAGRRIGVVGLRGGVGVTHLAACLARTFTHHPVSVGMISNDPHSPLPEWTKTPDAWPHVGGEGPLLPKRLAAVAPQWRRVRILSGRCPSPQIALMAAAALSQCHDVVVEDRGRLLRASDADELSHLVVVFSGDRSDLQLWDAVGDGIGVPLVPVVRTHPTGTVCTPADVADFLGRPVLTLTYEKGARMAPSYGGEPGDSRRGSASTVSAQIVSTLMEEM